MYIVAEKIGLCTSLIRGLVGKSSGFNNAFSERVYARSVSLSKEPLNQSAAALSGSFAPTFRFENLEIRKGFLQFPNLNLEQNPSLTALAI